MTRQTRVSMVAICAVALSLVAASPARAQRGRVRHPAPVRSVAIVSGYYGPFLYDPWYADVYFSPQYPYPPYPPGAPYSRDHNDSSLRIQVRPNDAEVFLDGYLVGNVDDFDGFFQRLRVRSGEHELTIYKDGYRTIRQKIYLSPGGTFRVQHEMERLRAGETPDPRPVAQRPPPPPQGPPWGPGDRARGDGRDDPRADPRGGDRDDRHGDPRGDGRGDPRRGANDFGTIAIRVQPANAEILIDGERWDHGADGDRLVVQVPGGRRHVEIRMPGRRMFSQDVDVRPGETVALNVSLRAEEH